MSTLHLSGPDSGEPHVSAKPDPVPAEQAPVLAEEPTEPAPEPAEPAPVPAEPTPVPAEPAPSSPPAVLEPLGYSENVPMATPTKAGAESIAEGADRAPESSS